MPDNNSWIRTLSQVLPCALILNQPDGRNENGNCQKITVKNIFWHSSQRRNKYLTHLWVFGTSGPFRYRTAWLKWGSFGGSYVITASPASKVHAGKGCITLVLNNFIVQNSAFCLPARWKRWTKGLFYSMSWSSLIAKRGLLINGWWWKRIHMSENKSLFDSGVSFEHLIKSPGERFSLLKHHSLLPITLLLCCLNSFILPHHIHNLLQQNSFMAHQPKVPNTGSSEELIFTSSRVLLSSNTVSLCRSPTKPSCRRHPRRNQPVSHSNPKYNSPF